MIGVLRQKPVQLWIILNCCDFILTWIAISAIGYSEGNPLYVSLKLTTIPRILAWKALLVIAVTGMIDLFEYRRIYKILNIGMATVCCWNLICIIGGV